MWRGHCAVLLRTVGHVPPAAGHTASCKPSAINWELPLFSLGTVRIWQFSHWEMSLARENCVTQGHPGTGHTRVQKPRCFVQTQDNSVGSRELQSYTWVS